MIINPNFAAALGMDMPEEEEKEQRTALVPMVNPTSIVDVDNSDLPNMADIDTKIAESELELQSLINTGMDLVEELTKTAAGTEAKFRGRMYEIVSTVYGSVLTGVKQKADLQLAKKKLRMEEADFVRSKRPAIHSGPSTVTVHTGTREDFLRVISESKDET